MKTLFLYIILLLASFLPIRSQSISVSQFPLAQQLPSNSVHCIFQDKDGILWLGTSDGLCRYDAYRVNVFRSSSQNPNLLSNNDITCLTETKDGNLLIGTRKGLNVMDKKRNKITVLQNKELNSYEIRSLVTDKAGYIWVGTYKRLVRCSPDFSEVKAYDSSLPVTSVNSVYKDHEENIWVMFWQKGLYQYNKEQDTFIRMPRIGNTDNPFRIFQDKKHCYWLTTWGEGVFRMYPEKGLREMYKPVKVEYGTEKEHKVLNDVFGVVEDDKYGYLWMVNSFGLTIADYEEDRLILIDMKRQFSSTSNIFNSIYKDASGNIWVSTSDESVYMINLDNPVVRNYPLSQIKEHTNGKAANICSLYQDEDGDLWFGQNQWGLGIYSPQKGTISYYKEFLGMYNIAFIGNVSSDPSEIWLTSKYASMIYVFKKEKTDGKPIRTKVYDLETIKGGVPQNFYNDEQGNVWITTDRGLIVKSALGDNLQKLSLEIPNMSDIVGDTEGAIWVSSTTNGLYKFSPICTEGKWSVTNLVHIDKENSELPSNDIETICADTLEKRIWIGTKEGDVVMCYTEGMHIRNATKNFKGYINESILNLTTDKIGHIWIATNKCIIEYNPRNKGKVIYNAGSDVVVNSFLKNSYWYSGKDFILYGGNRGIVQIFNSQIVNKDAGVVRTFVTDLKVNGVSILTGTLSEEDYSLDMEHFTLTLGANAHNIELSLSARNYSHPDKVLYAYRIKDLDKDWIYTNEERPFAYYTTLPKGKHTLELRATDENGLWSGRIVQYTIVKKPAFYETWWAYTLYILLTAGILYLAYRWMRIRMELRNELHIAQIEKEKTEELAQTKLRYFTNVSHDFLTPITIIFCLIDDMEMTYRNHIPQLDKMRSNLGKLKRLIQQILDFRKIENGKMELKVALGDLAAFLHELCRTNFVPLMTKKHISFEFDNGEEQCPAYFDADKLEKVVFNLLSNAYKYTDEGGIVRLSLDQKQENGHSFACISVADTGIGIPAEQLEHIFDRFFTSKEVMGSVSNGIGLSLVKEFLDLHHAVITVQSIQGKGSKFNIQLPIDKDSYTADEFVSAEQTIGLKQLELVATEEEAEQIIVENVQAITPADDRRMLIVEDNEELLELMYHIFSRHRQVLIAYNGSEAMDIVQKKEVDIIVSDVMMPEMDGLEFCRRLKQDIKTSHIPIILLTARNSVDDRVECYKAGADGYIAKPFELKILEARVENFLARKRIRQEEFKAAENTAPEKLELSSIDRMFLDKVIAYINENIENSELDMNELSGEFCMSKSTLYRKIKSVSGLSPVELVRNIRLKHAYKLLQEGISIMDTAFACGFSNPKYFSTCFKEQFGVSPKDFQKQL